MLKFSRQREAIKNFLATRCDHPTAEVVYLNLKEKYPKLSLGTVYRNLNLLASKGEITRISTGDADHFDCDISQHYHFVCNQCKQVYDIPVATLPQVDKAAEDLVGQVEGYNLMFHGICHSCLKRNKK